MIPAAILGILIVITMFSGIDYYCHYAFTKKRSEERKFAIKSASFDQFLAQIRKIELVCLTKTLFVAEDCLNDHTYMDEWTAQIENTCYRFNPIDYVRYRKFLKSDEVAKIPMSEHMRAIYRGRQ